MFRLIPVIDLVDGRVVRAVRGERQTYRPIESALVAGSEPVAVARALLARSGSPVLYVADLDAIRHARPQREALAQLLAALPGVTLWLDAGFADPADARARVGQPGGRLRPVYASESLESAAALDEVAGDPAAILSLDCRHARPMDRAGCWQRPSAWPATLIVMTLDRVGAAAGPDLDTFGRLRAVAPDRTWIGAGGLRDSSDLAAAEAAGAAGWLVASALHDGRLG